MVKPWRVQGLDMFWEGFCWAHNSEKYVKIQRSLVGWLKSEMDANTHISYFWNWKMASFTDFPDLLSRPQATFCSEMKIWPFKLTTSTIKLRMFRVQRLLRLADLVYWCSSSMANASLGRCYGRSTTVNATTTHRLLWVHLISVNCKKTIL